MAHPPTRRADDRRASDLLAVAGDEEDDEDLIASPPGLWLPRTVVKRHRRKANIIWVSLLLAFCAYIAYIVYDTIDSRRDPASSIEIKQEHYPFPDIAVCVTYLQGCLTSAGDCFDSSSSYIPWVMTSNYGFVGDPSEFEADEASLEVAEAYPGCSVIPLSNLEVNQTGIDDGDINYFDVSIFFLWDEDPWDTYDHSKVVINTQFVNVYFIDVNKEVEAIGEEIIDAKLPYERLYLATNETFIVTENHMVMGLTEFTGISTTTGQQLDKELTYSQSTTTAKQNWYWTATSSETLYSFLSFDMSISKFEYTSIEEVDPVDAWAIMGAIGGIWQFVVIAFGLFFVFSEKQRPDRKMRNMKKTVTKPATIISNRLSIGSIQDIEIDATDEDLPVEWVKRQRKSGHVYYFNVLTGAMQDTSPHGNAAVVVAGAAVGPPRPTGVGMLFQPAHGKTQPIDTSVSQSGSYGMSDGRHVSNDTLPPGWVARVDGEGRTYYEDKTLKRTQWERPVQRVPSAGGGGVYAVDTPMGHTRRGSTSSSGSSSVRGGPTPQLPPSHTRPTPAGPPRQSYFQAAPAADIAGAAGPARGAVNPQAPPPYNHENLAADGKTPRARHGTNETQLKPPYN